MISGKKTCSKCKIEKNISEFNNRSKNESGLKSNCKLCCSFTYKKWCKTNIGIILKRNAFNRYYRTEKGKEKIYSLNKIYAKTEKGKIAAKKGTLKYKLKNKEKVKAHMLVKNEIKQGRLKKQPCGRCQKTEKVHAHHESYLRPLNVVWLCPMHHKERHAELDRMI